MRRIIYRPHCCCDWQAVGDSSIWLSHQSLLNSWEFQWPQFYFTISLDGLPKWRPLEKMQATKFFVYLFVFSEELNVNIHKVYRFAWNSSWSKKCSAWTEEKVRKCITGCLTGQLSQLKSTFLSIGQLKNSKMHSTSFWIYFRLIVYI